MLYELAHFTKDKCSFLWDAVEWGNACVFSLRHRKALKGVPKLLEGLSGNTFTLRVTENFDALKLEKFFAEQLESAFELFKPHEFDRESIQKILRNKAQTFVVLEQDEIVGYFPLCSFINGKCSRGRMLGYRSRGEGVGKLIAKAIEQVALHEGLRMFASISPNNYAPLNSAMAVSNLKIIRTLDNGLYYIECSPKFDFKKRRGVNIEHKIVGVFMAQVNNFNLAA